MCYDETRLSLRTRIRDADQPTSHTSIEARDPVTGTRAAFGRMVVAMRHEDGRSQTKARRYETKHAEPLDHDQDAERGLVGHNGRHAVLCGPYLHDGSKGPLRNESTADVEKIERTVDTRRT